MDTNYINLNTHFINLRFLISDWYKGTIFAEVETMSTIQRPKNVVIIECTTISTKVSYQNSLESGASLFRLHRSLEIPIGVKISFSTVVGSVMHYILKLSCSY